MAFIGHVCHFSIEDMENLKVSEFEFLGIKANELFKKLNPQE